jgi:hypothetical protein
MFMIRYFIIFLLAISTQLTFAFNGFQSEKLYKKYEILNEPIQTFDTLDEANTTDPCLQLAKDPNTKAMTLKASDVNLVDIVNIGKTIWKIVENGQSKVNLNLVEANALPAGAVCWNQLEQWNKIPKSKLVHVWYENYLGLKVIDFTYRVTYSYGGKVEGKGLYLANISVKPANLNVLWGGFNFDVTVSAGTPLNIGTMTNPIAGIQLDVEWRASSPLVKSFQSDSLFIGADGSLDFL